MLYRLISGFAPAGGRRCCPCVELVLEDDRGGLAVDPGAMRIALGSRRRPAGPAPFHRAHPQLGEMARQTLVPKGYRQSQERRDLFHPRLRLPVSPRRRSREAADRRPARRRPRPRRPGRARRRRLRDPASGEVWSRPSPARRRGPRPPARCVVRRDRPPTAGSRAPVGAGRRRTGRRRRAGAFGGLALTDITRLTRESIVGTDETQSGHGTISTSPNGASAVSASSMVLPFTSSSSSAGSRSRTRDADALTGNVTWPLATVPSPASISIESSTRR